MNEATINSVAEQTGKLDGIFDVLPPVMPVQTDFENLLILSIAGLLILIITAILIWRYTSCRSKAARELRSLARQLQQQNPDHRQTAYTLAVILRNGLKLNRLSHDTCLPPAMSSDQSRWQHYIERMASARYSRNGSDPDALRQLVLETRYWLRHWP